MSNNPSLKVLIVSAFYESGMPSLREHQYSRALSEGGYDVSLFVSKGSNVWRFSRSKMDPTIPDRYDHENALKYGFKIIRRNALLRISDFFIIVPPISLILRSDVVHVIEFRQGFTAIIAILAKILGKKVVYDHEQRGDRHYSILHSVDSLFRRVLIFLGSFSVDYMRHTVFANKNHYLKNSIKTVDLTFAPLGADENFFKFSKEVRDNFRQKLGLEGKRVLLFSGKITDIKRPLDVIESAIKAGFFTVVVGRIDPKLLDSMKSFSSENVLLAGWQPMSELNKYYCAADCVVFTAFSVSYWEAAATGVEVVVPNSNFSKATLSNYENFHLFGETNMFITEDEYINPKYDIVPPLVNTLKNLKNPGASKRFTNEKFLWSQKRIELVDWYNSRLSRS